MEFFNNHTRLFRTALGLFLFLTIVVAILPAYRNQEINAPLPNATALSPDAVAGKKLFIANGCVACHSQQVRNVDMDRVWGKRPSIAADYASAERTDFWRNTATLMGTERTGPDLTDIGNRQPSQDWHLVHLYQPRAVVEQSIMPAYPWLFAAKKELSSGDVEVKIPAQHLPNAQTKIVATRKALQLVAYLQSLKQTPLPGGEVVTPQFLYQNLRKKATQAAKGELPDGKLIYMTNCQSCHQANGEGLKGAFPALKGSPIVTGDDLDLYVNIIMRGYDARAEFGTMPAIGLNVGLSPAEVTALINHERSSWGNQAKAVSLEEVSKIMDFIQKTEKK